MAYQVPFADPKEHYRRYKADIDGALQDCLVNGDLIHRRQLFDFEKHLAAYVGTKDAVGLSSGYHALYFALLAANIGAGDEVITVAHTFAATVSAIVHCGAKPVLVEVGTDYNMDMEAMERAIGPKTKAVIPVHLNGRVCDMDRLHPIAQKHKLAVIEDACQSLGATYQGKMAGSFGAGCFSFYPFKALGGLGDGGALTTNDPAVARTARLLRYNGEDRETGEFHYHGYTALLDNIQAAVLDAKLKHFPEWVEHRRHMAGLYQQALSSVSEIVLPHFPLTLSLSPKGEREKNVYGDSYQNYVIRAQQRDGLREHLKQAGVETLVSWPKPLWHHPALKLGKPNLPFSEQLCREVLSLPLTAETTPKHVETTATAIRSFYSRS